MNEIRNLILCQALCDSLNYRTVPGTRKYFLFEDNGKHHFGCADRRSEVPVSWSFSASTYGDLSECILSYLEDEIEDAQ